MKGRKAMSVTMNELGVYSSARIDDDGEAFVSMWVCETDHGNDEWHVYGHEENPDAGDPDTGRVIHLSMQVAGCGVQVRAHAATMDGAKSKLVEALSLMHSNRCPAEADLEKLVSRVDALIAEKHADKGDGVTA
jgi:hypothetical protein